MNQWTGLDGEAVRRTCDLGSLKLPRREAPRVQVEAVEDAVPAELNLEFQRIPRGQLATHCTHRSASRATGQPVGLPQRQPAASDDVAGLMSEFQLVRHTRGGSIAPPGTGSIRQEMHSGSVGRARGGSR